jgi:hypothetical protein
VVAPHNADFDLPNACVVHTDRDHSVFVSYRIGKKIFWTEKSHNPAHRRIFAAGAEDAADSRCGKHISEAPMAPLPPAEPSGSASESA